MSREQEQGTPEWYVAELHALASAITGRGVGVCNGAALTIQRLSRPQAASTTNDSCGSSTQADECRCPQHGSWVAADDVKRLVRRIDVAINGEAGAAKQASLCDVTAQIVRMFASSTTPASDDATLAEGWHGAILDAGDIVANSTDQRIVSRASRIVTWLKAHKPTTRAPGVDEARAIVAEMREWGEGEGCFNDDPEGKPLPCVYWSQQSFLALCDRLEAALTAAQEGAQGERGGSDAR